WHVACTLSRHATNAHDGIARDAGARLASRPRGRNAACNGSAAREEARGPDGATTPASGAGVTGVAPRRHWLGRRSWRREARAATTHGKVIRLTLPAGARYTGGPASRLACGAVAQLGER